jgi:hypothetical protein
MNKNRFVNKIVAVMALVLLVAAVPQGEPGNARIRSAQAQSGSGLLPPS